MPQGLEKAIKGAGRQLLSQTKGGKILQAGKASKAYLKMMVDLTKARADISALMRNSSKRKLSPDEVKKFQKTTAALYKILGIK